MENRKGGEGKRKVEESLRMVENRLKRKLWETEEKWKESKERLKNMVEKLEREVNRRMEEDGGGEEYTRLIGGNDGMVRNGALKERIEIIQNRIMDGVRQVEKEDRGVHSRIDKLKSDMARNRIERQDFERNEKEDKEIQDTKDSEREMEEKLEGAMEQMKILNLDFGRQCTNRNRTDTHGTCTDHMWMQDCGGKDGSVIEEIWGNCIVSMAKGMYGLCGQNSRGSGQDVIR